MTARFDGPGLATVLADWARPGMAMFPTGEQIAIGGPAALAQVQATRATSRVDSYEGMPGEYPAQLRGLGMRASVAAPVIVGGELWGAVAAGSAGAPFTSDTEARLGAFAELVGQAIANVEARVQLTESRARLVATADDARRRIERDLHDGAQQRLVALALSLGLVAKGAEPRTAAAVEAASPSSTPRWTSCASSRAASTPSCSPSAAWSPPCRPSPPARRSRSASTPRSPSACPRRRRPRSTTSPPRRSPTSPSTPTPGHRGPPRPPRRLGRDHHHRRRHRRRDALQRFRPPRPGRPPRRARRPRLGLAARPARARRCAPACRSRCSTSARRRPGSRARARRRPRCSPRTARAAAAASSKMPSAFAPSGPSSSSTSSSTVISEGSRAKE